MAYFSLNLVHNTRWNGLRRMVLGTLITTYSFVDGEKVCQQPISFSQSPFWVQVWGLPFKLMTEEIGRDIGSKIGNYVETDKRSWQADQARFMKVRVELQVDKSF